jgi:hypothetical protein
VGEWHFRNSGIILRETEGTFRLLTIFKRQLRPSRVVDDLPGGLAARRFRQSNRGRRLDEGRLDEKELQPFP